MGSLFGGGGNSEELTAIAMKREADATAKQDALIEKQDAEAAKLKAEEDATKERLETRRRRIASGQIGSQSLLTAGELGYSRTLGAR